MDEWTLDEVLGLPKGGAGADTTTLEKEMLGLLTRLEKATQLSSDLGAFLRCSGPPQRTEDAMAACRDALEALVQITECADTPQTARRVLDGAVNVFDLNGQRLDVMTHAFFAHQDTKGRTAAEYAAPGEASKARLVAFGAPGLNGS